MSAISPEELGRLREIAALRLAEDVEDPRLQALVDRAAEELGLPLAAISIVLDSAQYFMASHGVGGWMGVSRGTAGEWAFCRNVVDRREPFVVEDASCHPIVRGNPLVKIDGIRSYLGVPLMTGEYAVGTLCVLGLEAHQFSQSDLDRLAELAGLVIEELERRREPPAGAPAERRPGQGGIKHANDPAIEQSR